MAAGGATSGMTATPDLFARSEGLPDIVPARKLTAKVAGVYRAPADDFQSRAAKSLEVSFDGIAGDFHAGTTRRSGGREPWYPRGTEMRNERQLSLVAPDELALVAQRMQLDEIRPEWIGANLLVEGWRGSPCCRRAR